MSTARLIITAVVLEHRTQAEVARTYGVSKGWVSKLITRYRSEGEGAFETRWSRRPKTTPNATPDSAVALILDLRRKLVKSGLDAGPDTIPWHLAQHHQVTVARATISRHLAKAGLVRPEPKKKPKSSYIRFQAAMPNETWQSDFTHCPLRAQNSQISQDTEILTWLDDCTRMALSVTAHRRITAPIVLTQFRQAIKKHRMPASTLTNNGMVFTTRLAAIGRQGGRNALEAELRRLHVTQKNGKPNHPQTQGKVERFQLGFAAGFSGSFCWRSFVLTVSITVLESVRTRRSGVVGLSYFLVIFAPSRSLETSFCCGAKWFVSRPCNAQIRFDRSSSAGVS